MARPGRTPIPPGLKIVRSGRLPDRSREVTPRQGELVPPYPLSAETQVVWDRVIAELVEMGVAKPCDVDLLACYVEAVTLHQRVSRELVGQPLLQQGVKSEVINKLLTLQQNTAALALRLGAEFGLTAATRNRVEAFREDSGPNPFA